MNDEPKRLFEINVTLKTYAAADSYTEALEVWREAITSGEVHVNDFEVDASEVMGVEDIELKWRGSIPVGGELTCLDQFEERRRYERER